MNNIIIEVERKTGKSFCENNKIGVQHSNLQNKIIYKLDEMINGVAWLEYEIDGKKYFAEMDAIDMGYQIDIKSCLLVSDYVNIDLKITENENANGIPIFVSTITELDVYESIGASNEEPEEYPSWLDEANAKIAEITTLDNTISQHENIRVQNETTRVQNENGRISNENQRVTNENQRVASEETRLSNEETRINNDVARETRIESLENNKADKTEIPDVSSFITKNVNNLTNYELKTNTGSLISLNINSSNYVITIQLKNSDGTVISTDTIDLPLESVVVGGRYDNNTKKVILTLENGNIVDFSVADLVSGLQTEITSNNMLESDLVDDSNSGHKFVSISEKNNWNGKQDILTPGNNISIENDVISATDTTYDISTSSKDGLMSKSDKLKLDSINVNNLELKSNKVTEISNTSTNDEYPGAKCVYDSQESQNTLIKDLQTENSTLKNIVNNIYDLENILPNETEESDEDISFNNTMNKAPLNITLKGNLGQTTYTGKNLLGLIIGRTDTVNGVTITITPDGYVKLHGTANGNINKSYNWAIAGSTYSSKEYTYSSTYSSGTVSSNFAVNIRSGSTQTSTSNQFNPNSLYVNNSLRNETFTASGSGYITGIQFIINNGVSFNNFIIKLQVEQGSTATDYEPYVGGVPSPNPEYPQDIKVVKGNNTINIIGKNLFDKDNANVLNDIYIDENLRMVKAASNVKSIYMKILGGKTYTVSKIASSRFRVATTKVFPADNVSVYNYTKNESGTNITITANNDSQYMVIFLYNSTVDTLTFEQILDSIQIEKGSTATDYEPHQEQSYVFYLEDLELCKIGDYQDYIYKSNNTWYKYKTIDKVVLDGSETYSRSSAGGYRRFSTVISNAITLSGRNEVFSNNFYFSSDANNTGVTFLTSGSVYLYYGVDETSISDFTTWLSTHNTTVYYILETPVSIEITDLDLIEQLNQLYNAYSYHKQTNIYQNSSELPFYLNIKAIKEI